MTIREVLKREHALIARLLDALAAGLERPPARARAETTRALNTLLPTLDSHEELEDLVFESDLDGLNADILAVMREQHDELGVIRGEILDAIELADECPLERLLALSRFLSSSLRSHLEMEETHLWPLFARMLDAKLPSDQEASLGARAHAMERHVRRGLTAISSSFH